MAARRSSANGEGMHQGLAGNRQMLEDLADIELSNEL